MNQYQLIDSGQGRKLEKVGPQWIVRPSPQALWRPQDSALWKPDYPEFIRQPGGGGYWKNREKFPSEINVAIDPIQLKLKLTDFGHLGVFAEQQDNWNRIFQLVQAQQQPNILNLFAYTGGSTLAAALAGAKVCHVDASKVTVNWARENAELNQLAGDRVRWIVDDACQFVSREARRKSFYSGVILDPPSFGRGNRGQVWKIEQLNGLLDSIKQVLLPGGFILLSSHSSGMTPEALKNMLVDLKLKGQFMAAGEMTITDAHDRKLPSGASVILDQIQRS